MSATDAIAAAMSLRDTLSRAVAHARAGRTILKSMNADALMQHAIEREGLNRIAAQYSEAMARAIQSIAQAHGHDDLDLAGLSAILPLEGAQLSSVVAEIRALSAALKELDELHQQLATRAVSFVRAYLTQLAPRPATYSRRGAPIAQDTATRSEHA